MSTSCMLHTITKRAEQIDKSAHREQQRSLGWYKYRSAAWAARWRKCVSSRGSIRHSHARWFVGDSRRCSARDESGARQIASGSGLFLLERLGYRHSSTRPNFDLHFPAAVADHKGVAAPALKLQRRPARHHAAPSRAVLTSHIHTHTCPTVAVKTPDNHFPYTIRSILGARTKAVDWPP